MNEFFIVFDEVTGEERWRGQAPASPSSLPQGLKALVVPREAILGPTANLAPIKAALGAKIDREADEMCLRFVSVGLTQMARYERKEMEARAWTPQSDPANFPFLRREAASTSRTIDSLAAEVIALADFWIEVGSKIEAARRGAKVAIEAAANLAEISQASEVDWEAVVE